MSIQINFEGWFQCRLATDPDPYDDPRGVRGWTFAYTGEPNLDRLIRFHDPVALRSHAQPVSVIVTQVRHNGTIVTASPLIGAQVRMNQAMFEGRNGDIAISAQEPVAPFDLEITQGRFKLTRLDPIDLNDLSEITRRQPINFIRNDAELRQAIGVTDPEAFRLQRVQKLQSDLNSATDATIRGVLQLRIDELEQSWPLPNSVQKTTLMARLVYQHTIRGAGQVDDPDGLSPAAITTNTPWQARYWMGGWDADTLCGFTRGSIDLTT